VENFSLWEVIFVISPKQEMAHVCIKPQNSATKLPGFEKAAYLLTKFPEFLEQIKINYVAKCKRIPCFFYHEKLPVITVF